MTSRTTQSVVRFAHAFQMSGFDRPEPAGEYRVDHDEELLEAGSRLAWHRTRAFIHLPAIGTTSATQQMVPITAADLDAALLKDTQQ